MEIIKRPLVTEKLTSQNKFTNRFGFVVDKRAGKIEIKAAVEKMYGVSVVDVNTMIYRGKTKTRYTKKGFNKGRTNSFKKAIVTLAQNETIDFYSNI